MVYLMQYQSQQWYYIIQSCWDKGVHTVPADISSKVNEIAWLEIELANFEAEVQHFD